MSLLSPTVYTTLFGVAAVCAIVASVAVVWSVRPRRRATADGGSALRGMGDLVWAVIPTVALFVVLAYTWPQVRATAAHAAETRAEVPATAAPTGQP
jgi:heme/copper-type cytochrome/quinol oxidase subunit 2